MSTARGPERLVVIGGSAGSLEILLALLARWPWRPDSAALVVLHRQRAGSDALEKLLTQRGIGALAAEDRSPLSGGSLLLAPPDFHLLLADRTRVMLSLAPPVWHCRPAIDVTLASAARCFGPDLTAVVLSGANADGAQGSAETARLGGRVLVQRPDLAEVPRMPRAALDAVPGASPVSTSDMLNMLER